MLGNDLESTLCNEYSEELFSNLEGAFLACSKEYHKEAWENFGNKSGHFIEHARRIIELKCFGKHTPLSEKLPNFTNATLSGYENVSKQIASSFRIVIPRTLYFMQSIRNNRGTVHPNDIKPNKMDASIMFNSEKWILAELIRLGSTQSAIEATAAIESIMSKEIGIIWHINGTPRVLTQKMNYEQQVLILLCEHEQMTVKELLTATEYKNTSRFKTAILQSLHRDRMIEYDTDSGSCHISPLGIKKTEEILKNGDA